MKTPFKILIASLFMITLFLCLCSHPTEKTDKADDNTNGFTGNTTGEIIKEYAEEAKLQLSVADIDEIESYTKQFPILVTSGKEAVIVEMDNSMGTDLVPVINQRDWAYAYLGIQYTFIGIFVENQESLLTKALWCFLEAASLNPKEQEHLANIAFHLNGMEEYYDAITVLETAKSLLDDDSVNVMVSNNLSYAYAGIGDTVMALIELNYALSLWPNNEFLLEKYRLYSASVNGSNGNDYSTVFGVSCHEIDNIELNIPQLDVYQLSPEGGLFLIKVQPLDLRYISKFSQLPLQNCPASLDDVMDLWLRISQLRGNRTSCYDVTENNEICEKCDKPYESAMHSLAVSFSGQVIASNLNFQTQALNLASAYRDSILDLIKNDSSMSDNDKAVYSKYYKEYFLYQTATIWEISVSNICYAKDLEKMYRPQLYCYIYEPPTDVLPLGGKISVWFGAGSVAIDANKGEVEIQFGQGWQGSVAWNWKTGTPTLGIGYGINLDKLIQPGAFIRYTPGKGFKGSIDINPATNFVLPGVSAPQISIAKLGAFMN